MTEACLRQDPGVFDFHLSYPRQAALTDTLERNDDPGNTSAELHARSALAMAGRRRGGSIAV